MAVKISLEFFLNWIQAEPMKSPSDPPGVAGEVFRVDAMASEQGIMVGGWETYETSDPRKARWFSVALTRKNCPWLYIRGEPHRTIAASELLAVTLAVVLFGPLAKWKQKHGRLVISGFTDNASNSYLIDKYLSVKFPVSMVLMELSRQLGALGAELQLHWIPREQNEESDNLSKGRLDAFDPKLRVEVDWDRIPWLVIPRLVDFAMEFDKEIQLKKGKSDVEGSKKPAATGRTPPEEKLRLRQPWWFWRGEVEQGHFAWQSKSASAERRHEIPNERMKHEDWSLVTMSDRSCSVDLIGPPTHTWWGSGARSLRLAIQKCVCREKTYICILYPYIKSLYWRYWIYWNTQSNSLFFARMTGNCSVGGAWIAIHRIWKESWKLAYISIASRVRGTVGVLDLSWEANFQRRRR